MKSKKNYFYLAHGLVSGHYAASMTLRGKKGVHKHEGKGGFHDRNSADTGVKNDFEVMYCFSIIRVYNRRFRFAPGPMDLACFQARSLERKSLNFLKT